MKRINNLYEETAKLSNIIDMTERVCKRVVNKRKVDRFECYRTEYICNIKRRLDNRDLDVGKYNIFMITDPKCRIVMAQEIEDKIINHLIADYVLVKVFEDKYIDSMCATRIGKGTSYAIKLLKRYINNIKKDNKDIYVLKLDISKYFYRIDHEVLKEILREKIKDSDALNILDSIIDSTNSEYVNKKISKLKENRIEYLKNSNICKKDKLIKEVEDIPLYSYGKGLALGNQTSQAFGLIYVYKLMHYMKEELHLKYVINFMDDIIVLHHDKKYLYKCLDKIVNKLKNEYKLDINNKKTKIYNIKEGIDFLGYRFYFKNNRLILRIKNQTKKRFKKKYYSLRLLYNNKIINKKDINVCLSSYKGLLMTGSCNNLYYKLMGGKL